MKVLFAVSNDEISESVVKKYQREYKEIISYKNVYYFNAILKEIQKDKTYDRIVISEDLEAFTHTQYDQIDKFIFDKLDSISDEASNLKGNDTPIILICSERRTKSEEMLVKLFGIGIYNAIIGNDRSIEEVCKLIHRPRLKKEAKAYYKIDVEDVKYQAENENDVSEVEIQNILAHYKKLGKDESEYVNSFDKIAQQYNDTQLKVISKFLPLNVRAVLEEKSDKYQQIISFNNSVANSIRQKNRGTQENLGPSQKLLKPKNQEFIMSKPIVIPSSVNVKNVKKLSKVQTKNNKIEIENDNIQEENTKNIVSTEITEINKPKKRGRPRKNPLPQQSDENVNLAKPQRKRGRPRKNPLPEQSSIGQETVSNNVDNDKNIELETLLTGFEKKDMENVKEETFNVLPGFENDNIIQNDSVSKDVKEDVILPGFENEKNNNFSTNIEEQYNSNDNIYSSYNESNIDIVSLLSTDKKIASFVGTSKNGTSFIVSNLAEYMSSIGVSTAILDTTKNRNSYYIYTKNEEHLRNVAMNSIDGLVNGQSKGIKVNNYLDVYTALPNENNVIDNVEKILQTLVNNYSLILIDCDFDTPINYFKNSQQIYLVQSLDILTIQPLTAFLRELKAKDILEQSKLRIILNKYIKVKGITEKTIIGGMAFYNDPAMSFMTELFDRNLVKYISIPFEEEIYTKYLEGIINCDISIKKYSKTFMQVLKELGNMVYPMTSSKTTYQPPTVKYSRGFSTSMNDTLSQMKQKY